MDVTKIIFCPWCSIGELFYLWVMPEKRKADFFNNVN